MGNIFSQKQALITYKWEPPEQHDLCIPLHDLNDLTYPLSGKILIPFSQAHHQRQFIYRNHHKVILLNDAPQLLSYFEFQFRGVPIFKQEQLLQNVQKCIQAPFDMSHCPIPIILQRFDESLLKSYLDAFVHYGVKVQYFESLQQFLNASCCNSQLVCSNIELEQLSCRIQNLTFSRESQQKMTILCFCNKDQYIYPKKTQLAMQSNHIEVHLFHNMLEIVQKIHVETLVVQSETQDLKQKVLFFLNQKEKEYQYLLKKGKKLEKTIKNLKAIKTSSKARLVEKIEYNQYLVVVLSNDSKEMKGHLDVFENLEEKGLEDRAIFLRRDSQMSYKVMQKIENTLSRPKFIKRQITQKPLIFYGTLQAFKFVLKSFPKLTFKKFIEKTKESELLPFLQVRNQVVMTHLKVCECMPGWEIRCKMIYVKIKHSTVRLLEQKEISGCSKENWFATEEQLIAYYQGKNQVLLGLDCDYGYKKMSTISRIVSEIFSKLKEKKTILINQLYGSIFLFSCEYYFLDQISVFVIRYFNSKLLGSYDKPCILEHLRFSLYRELLQLHRTARIESEVISAIQNGSIANIFQLSDMVMSLAVEYPYFLEQINSVWQLLLHQDRPEYLSNCQVLLFLMLLSFNKASFAHYHNQTLQHLTLKIKGGLIAYEDEALSLFASKTKNSFVYNFNFILCQEYQKDQPLESGDILIRLEGSQLNNFGLYLPVWKHERQCLIAPLTKFQLITSRNEGLILKLSLNSQQKMLQKFTQHFLEDKGGLRLFKEPRELRKLDCFLESMCSGRFQTAGFIIKKMITYEQVQNVELLNAYIILHNLKCGEIEEAYGRLQRGKYYDLLSRLIASCREGSSVQAAHSEVTGELTTEDPPADRYSVDSVNNLSATEMELKRNATTDVKGKWERKQKRSPSDIFRREERIKKSTTGRRMPVPVRHQKRKNVETSALESQHQSCPTEDEEVKIKIFSPANESISESKDSFEANKRITANFNLNLMDHSKDIFSCSLSRLNSCNSEKSFISELFQFEDPINETVQEPSLTKRQSKGKPSNFLQIEAQRIKNTAQTDETLSGTGTTTGKFNFGHSSNEYQEIVNEELEEEEIYDMSPVAEEQSQKLSESEVDMRMLSASSDFFKFSLGFNPNGEKLIPRKRQSNKLPRSSIQQDRNVILQKLAMLTKLGNIEEECSCLPSNTNLSRSNINLLSSNVSDKQNRESTSQKSITHRPEGKKLFTFCKNQEIRPRFSGQGSQALKLPSSSLLVSQDSNVELPVAKQITQKEELFCIFGNQERSHLQSMNSISSIDLLDAEPVGPQDLMITQTHQ